MVEARKGQMPNSRRFLPTKNIVTCYESAHFVSNFERERENLLVIHFQTDLQQTHFDLPVLFDRFDLNLKEGSAKVPQIKT